LRQEAPVIASDQIDWALERLAATLTKDFS